MQLERESIEEQMFFYTLPDDDPHHARGRKQLRLPFKSEGRSEGATNYPETALRAQGEPS
jgi:hypothetical protein